jgi:hypothetical protein
MGGSRFTWFLTYALVVVGMAVFFVNAEAVLNGDAVECDGSRMSPGQGCVYGGGGDGTSYEEEKANEARDARIGYAGAGVCVLGIALAIGNGVISWRRGR